MADQYQQYSTVRKYWHLMRPHTLTASIVPVLVGTATAKLFLLGSQDHIKFSLFLAMLIACLLIQAATNMFNEYYDFKKGLDDHTSVGIGGAIVRNGMSPKLVMNLAIAFYIIAALLGIYLAVNSSFWITFMAAMYILAYLIVIFTALFKSGGSLFYLLVLFSFPMPIKAIRRFNKNDTPASMMPAMAATGKTNTVFGILYALGIYISALLGGI